ELTLEAFLTGYRSTALRSDELLTAVLVPGAMGQARSSFHKLGIRRYLVISIAMVAVALAVDDDRIGAARVAIGACSPVALRIRALEDELVGRAIADDLGAAPRPEHMAALSPIDDIRATAGYRRSAALAITRRALAECGTGR
ncbi:MAG TPA: xanthine dehydrogenase family protein subunit M, partial [Actinomycetota bacterium]